MTRIPVRGMSFSKGRQHTKGDQRIGKNYGLAKIWLDDDGAFRFGKHEGEMAEYVVRDDPEYVEWALSEAQDMCEEDQEVLTTLLYRAGR